MLLSALALLAGLPPTDVIAVGSLVLAERRDGVWSSVEERQPQIPLPAQFRHFGLAKRYEEFTVNGFDEGEVGGIHLDTEKYPETGASQWGPNLRMPRRVDILPTGDLVSTTMITDYVKSKGIAKPNVYVWQVYMVDLDGNGVRERIVAAGSFGKDDLHGTVKKGDFYILLLRHVNSKGKPTVIELDGRVWATKPTGRDDTLKYYEGIAAIADVDADGIMEVISEWAYYEGQGAALHRFSKGTVEKLAEAGYGA